VVLELLAHLFRDEGRTLILVTHSRKVSEITDRVLALANGRLTDETEAISW
jgi:predicted ABC-type transport system involved in lysophospholipase L1 biosynthesis ATPase subunit